MGPLRKKITQQLQSELCMTWPETDQYIKQCRQTFKDTGLITVDFNQVNYLLNKDLGTFRDTINRQFKDLMQQHKPILIDEILALGLTKQQVIEQYLADTGPSFAKTLAPQLATNLNWIVDTADINWNDSFFIRNIINNENIIARCFEEHKDFWFVDTGYTNFLEHKHKKWHRLIFKDLHHGYRRRHFPTDRMSIFSHLPRSWRSKGTKILVIESSENHYRLNGTTLEQWKTNLTKNLSMVTDRPIEFRPKDYSRKTRGTVYDLLTETKDYYCVISDSSAAAVEAVWAGIPIITLSKHITNSVSRKFILDINDLYREDIEQWMAMLSYSQWTFDELQSGKALALTQEWHSV